MVSKRTGGLALNRSFFAPMSEGLVGVGILEKRIGGRRSHIKADADSPIFPGLCGLIGKIGGVCSGAARGDHGQQRSEGLCSLRIPGLREEGAESDVRLMLMGDVKYDEIGFLAESCVERVVGRQVQLGRFSLSLSRRVYQETKPFRSCDIGCSQRPRGYTGLQ